MTDQSDLALGPGKHTPDWSRFGLSEEQLKESEKSDPNQDSYHKHHSGDTQHNELFAQDSSSSSKPWWQMNFFISEPVLFGTWDGVFTSCMINIFGIIIFLRTGWMVGNAGIGFSVLVILLTISVALIAALSAIGVCEQCRMESGGVYFLLSHVMGARFGASIGILYCFGMAVACSLYVIGFGESISSLINADASNTWTNRGIAIGVVLMLLGINVAGVKWVIRLQLVLLMILFVAVLDFLVGSFVHTDYEHGFLGYHTTILSNNTSPSYLPGESFFTVFGVFFPTATGVFAGINMSGDLANPSRNIPVGTLSAVGVSTFLYLSFAVVLGGTCTRSVLQTDYMISEKVSIVGFLFLAGLYISSISSCMGGLYGSPRILQCIANENVIPIIKVLGHGRGPNKVPVYSLCVVTAITLIFIFVGDVNTLGPIVTMPFMLTYAAVDYCYFTLAMSFRKRRCRHARFTENSNTLQGGKHGYSPVHNYGSTKPPQSGADLDKLFPERSLERDGTRPLMRGEQEGAETLESPTFVAKNVSQPPPPYEKTAPGEPQTQDSEDTAGLLTSKPVRPTNDEISQQPQSFYSPFCNHWVSLLGACVSLVIMFSIQWLYALANISVCLIIYFYIGQANPGVSPGIAEFNFIEWIRDGVKSIFRSGPPPSEQIVVTPNTPAMRTMAAQLTEDNEDFAERERYHQSEVVKGENFDDYQD